MGCSGSVGWFNGICFSGPDKETAVVCQDCEASTGTDSQGQGKRKTGHGSRRRAVWRTWQHKGGDVCKEGMDQRGLDGGPAVVSV